MSAPVHVIAACFRCRQAFDSADFVAGETLEGRTVYHVLHDTQHTVLLHWFTFNPDAIFTPGQLHSDQWDRRTAGVVFA